MHDSTFHPLVESWFSRSFEKPTEAQARGWPAIAQGRHTLIASPTGSGKTLAAFLTCIDGLVRAGLDGGLPERTEVVYVSPLKALSNDIERNLSGPLSEIHSLAEERGTPLPEIRVAVRTGDTPARERQAMAKRPPHILITTPESLYILLTSKSGRLGLGGVRTLILDELHAVAGDKRGAHLSLSVERLCELADSPVTRIGLSATQNPIDEMARLMVGTGAIAPDGKADCLIVDTGRSREIDIGLVLPEDELGPIATHEQWGQCLDLIARLVRKHQTTLLFVNTRRLVERVSHQLAERLGEECVAAHHGSLSQKTRHEAERRLKRGEVRLCVATSSLELGIDIGAVDLVCQIGSPRSIGLLMQRVGRSGHHVGGTPKGRLFPLTRDELLESLALVRGVRRGNLDRLRLPVWPLDVLAQQIVAECASREWDEGALYDMLRRAYPYRELPRDRYEQVIDTIANGVSPRIGRRSAYLHRDSVNGRLRGRRGARLAALTSGGAIPDNADYDVIAEPENTFVGTVNEDFAIESMRGDVFLLGNTPWRILRIESGKVRVESAHGAAPNVPFWIGEAPGRTNELSDEVSDLREEIYRRGANGDALHWLTEETGCTADAAEQARAYIDEGARILGTVPTKHRVVAERFFDESGGMQLVIHSPFGSRINRAWGMSLRKEICRTFDFELQAAATEDGINLSLGPSLSFPVEDTFRYVPLAKAEKVLTQAVLQAPLFGIRWRWAASRALAILRFSSGRKVPPPLQRMRSDDLLAAVFPAQVECQDNAPPGDIEVPDHPLVAETVRDCLTEAMDLDGMKDVLDGIARGEIEVYARDTTQPSVFSHQILNAMPYAFLDDAPLEERRSRAVALRRALPEDSRELASLDPAAIGQASRDAWPIVRDADELHDALLTLALLPQQDVGRGAAEIHAQRWSLWLRQLVEDGRAAEVRYGVGRTGWVAAETAALVAAAFPDAEFTPALPTTSSGAQPPTVDDAELALVRGRAECVGPFTAVEMAEALGLSEGTVEIALANMESTGNVLRGRFTRRRGEEEFCDRRILARIHRSTIAGLRKQVEPVSAATFIRFLAEWQHCSAASRAAGVGGLLDVIEQLQGFEAAAGAWESDILNSRVEEYSPSSLDELCYSGEVAWGRFSRGSSNGASSVNSPVLSRAVPISMGLRASLPWLLQPQDESGSEIVGAARDVLDFLRERGASFLQDIAAGTQRLPSETEKALWQLAANGAVTTDGFNPVRSMVDGTTRRVRRSGRSRRGAPRRSLSSRWSLLDSAVPVRVGDASAGNDEKDIRARGMQLLQRYGVVFPEVLRRDALAPRWRELAGFYRRAEARGEVRGGRFVAGFVGEQFALPEAVERLRGLRNARTDGRLLTVSACDPLNLAGVLTPGPRVASVPANKIVLRDGVPVAALEGGEVRLIGDTDEATRTALQDRLLPGGRRRAERAPVAVGGR